MNLTPFTDTEQIKNNIVIYQELESSLFLQYFISFAGIKHKRNLFESTYTVTI